MWWMVVVVVVAIVVISAIVIKARDKIVLFERGDYFLRLYPNPGVRVKTRYLSVSKGYRREY